MSAGTYTTRQDAVLGEVYDCGACGESYEDSDDAKSCCVEQTDTVVGVVDGRLRTMFEVGPDECPRCLGSHVVPGHSVGITGRAYPAWVCDSQKCGIAICWRRETQPCGTDACENETSLVPLGDAA